MKKDLEFTPPLDEYTYLEPETNHVSKDEFHQEPLHEMETDQGRKGWKKRLRHLLTAGVTAAVIFVPTTPNLQPEPDRPEWIEFDIEIDGVPLHFPCQESEALSSLSERKHGEDYLDATDGFIPWVREEGSRPEDSIWYAVQTTYLDDNFDIKGIPCPFNYRGLTEKSTLDDCFSVLGYPDSYRIRQYENIPTPAIDASWYLEDDDNGSTDPSVTIYHDVLYSIAYSNGRETSEVSEENSIQINADSSAKVLLSRNEVTGMSGKSGYISFEYRKGDESYLLDKIYILDADNLLPLCVEELSGTNIIEGKTLQEGDNIQIPVPGYEAWTIAFSVKSQYGDPTYTVYVFPHMEKWLSKDNLGFYYHEGDIFMLN